MRKDLKVEVLRSYQLGGGRYCTNPQHSAADKSDAVSSRKKEMKNAKQKEMKNLKCGWLGLDRLSSLDRNTLMEI